VPAQPTRPVPAPESVAQEETVAPRTAPAAIGGTYEVQRNDTLSKIARGVNPGASAGGLNQTMIALFRANPDAFAGNINVLKAGSVLRIPELADIEAISRSDANAEVAQQQQSWSSSFRTASEDESQHLRLVTPAETPAQAEPTATPSTATEPASAAGQGAATPAAEDKRLEVTNPGLSGVQQSVTDAAPATEAEIEAEPTTTAETPAQTEETTPAPAAEQPARVAKPARTQPQPAAEPSLVDRIGDFWWVPIAAGLLLVIGLIFVFLKRRREANEAPDLDAFTPTAFEPRYDHDAPAVATAARGRADVFSVDDDVAEEPLADFEDEPAPAAPIRKEAARTADVSFVEPKAVDDTLSSETSVRFDQQDALAEADFHMAYGLYDQAADLVKIAIEREPDRRDLKLKLLEIYFVWGNRDLFLDAARELHSTRDQEAAGEWDKVAIMGRQIAPEDPMFKAEDGAPRVDLVDVNLEGGENRVDLDLFAEPESDTALDMEFGSGEHKIASDSSASDLDFLLDEPQQQEADDEPTREMDPLARTQETPTIESPVLDRTSQTIREKVDSAAFGRSTTEQTAELSLDDLGLDVDALETTGALEQTASLEKDIAGHDEEDSDTGTLRDDEMTQLAPSLGSLDRTMEAPRVEKFDIESTGTVYIDQVDFSGGDTIEQPRVDADNTAEMKRAPAADLDVDLDNIDEADAGKGDTLRQPRAEADHFSDDVFADRTSEFQKIDLDVGEALGADDHAPTNKQVITTEMELSELEPVTMSEVGTKLDLARAYMDMGDPDGARSILEEVLQEGTSNQKQEAQRLLDSIR